MCCSTAFSLLRTNVRLSHMIPAGPRLTVARINGHLAGINAIVHTRTEELIKQQTQHKRLKHYFI